jgi:eukaryotic-like serine/threonine-protein kinase
LSEKERVLAGRYKVGELIGRGGMADVFEGIDLRLGRKVAIKLLKSDLASDESFESRFAKEAQASAKMAHPTIVRIYDAGEESSTDSNGSPIKTPFIIMEYVNGRLLRDIMHDKKLSLQEAVDFAKGVLSALEVSHKAGIIHRDIKASNIMITNDGKVKVMDFGIARAIADSSETQAHTAGIVGTAQYFSPEQARGEVVDSRTDLYSMGVLLYEMLAGRPPFKGDTAVSVAYQHVSEKVPAPSEHNPEITPELDQVVLNALAKDREERFQTAEEFREHLLAAIRGESLPKTGFTPKTTVVSEQQAMPTEVIDSVSADDFFKEIGIEYAAGEQTTSITVRERVTKELPSPKLLWGVGSGVAVTLVGLIIWLVALGGVFSPIDSNSATGVEVADVTGELFDDGSKTLKDQGLVVQRVAEVNDSVKEGLIIRTNPPSGRKVPAGTTIEVFVSSGKSESAVPLLAGLTEAQAKEALERAGLTLGGITSVNSATIAKGEVIESVPAANEQVTEGTAVKLLVSDGQVLVPSVVGMGATDARRAMEGPDVGFTAIVQPSATCASGGGTAGTVIASQSIPPGLANQKQSITLTLNCIPGAVSYTITFDGNGADSGSAPSNITGTGAKTLPNNGTLAKTGFTFGGWTIGGTVYTAGASYTLSSNVTATAVWIEIPAEDP